MTDATAGCDVASARLGVRKTLAAGFPVEHRRFSGEPAGTRPVAQIPGSLQAGPVPGRRPVADAQPRGLDILVRSPTDDMLHANAVHALWLGPPLKLKLVTMQRGGRSKSLLPKA
jgi:hypothetical protein